MVHVGCEEHAMESYIHIYAHTHTHTRTHDACYVMGMGWTLGVVTADGALAILCSSIAEK